MALEDTTLFEEFRGILQAGPKPVHSYWTCEIHVGALTHKAISVINLDISREYGRNYSDSMHLEVSLTRGVYLHEIIPNKDNLTVTLHRQPVHETGSEENYEEEVEVLTLRAFLIDEGDPSVEGGRDTDTDPGLADHTGLATVRFELADLAMEQMRLKTVGGIFRDAVPAEAMRALMGYMTKTLDLDEGARIKGVDLVPPSNTRVRQHVIIPHGTELMQLPTYIQNHCGGVYAAGLKHYLQRGIWYVFPEFDLTRFEESDRTLTILSVPPHRFPGIERTYSYDGKKLIVVSTGETRIHDDSEKLLLNHGNGVRFAAADRIMEGFSRTEGNRTSVSRKENAAEFIVEPRKTGLNHVPFSAERIVANSFRETSLLARRLLTHMELVWENSNSELLYPGMPLRLLYVKGEDLYEAYGTLSQANTTISAVGSGPSIGRHRSDTHLVALIEKIRKKEE